MTEDFYSNISKIDSDHNPVYILNHTFSFTFGPGRINMDHVYKMCSDASDRHSWIIFPQRYIANDQQHICRLLLMKAHTDVKGGDPRPTREDVAYFSAFISGWIAHYNRMKKKSR